MVKAPNWSRLHWLLPSSCFFMNETLLNTTLTSRKMNTSFSDRSFSIETDSLFWSSCCCVVRGQACWIGVCNVPLCRFDQSETGARLCQPIGAYWSRVERVVVCMMFTCKPADRRGHGPWFWRHHSVPALWRHDGPTGVRRLKNNCFFFYLFLLLLLSFHTMHSNDLNNFYYYY